MDANMTNCWNRYDEESSPVLKSIFWDNFLEARKAHVPVSYASQTNSYDYGSAPGGGGLHGSQPPQISSGFTIQFAGTVGSYGLEVISNPCPCNNSK